MTSISPSMTAVCQTLDQYTPVVCRPMPPQKRAKLSNAPLTELSPIEKIVQEALWILEDSIKNGEEAPPRLLRTLEDLKEAPNQAISLMAREVWLHYCFPSQKGFSSEDRKAIFDALSHEADIKSYDLSRAQKLMEAAHRLGFRELEEIAHGQIMKEVTTFHLPRGPGATLLKPLKRLHDQTIAVRNWALSLSNNNLFDPSPGQGNSAPIFRLCSLKTRASLGFPNRYYTDSINDLKAAPHWAVDAFTSLIRELDKDNTLLQELVLNADPYHPYAGGLYRFRNKYSRSSPGIDGYHIESRAANLLGHSLQHASKQLTHLEMDPRIASRDDLIVIAKAVGENTTLDTFVVQPIEDAEKKELEVKRLLEALEPNQTLRHLELGYLTDRSTTELEELRTFWYNHPNLQTMVFYACSNPFAKGEAEPVVSKTPERHEVRAKGPCSASWN